MRAKEITSDAVDFLLHDLDCEVVESEQDGLLLLTFTDGEKEYRTVDEIIGLLDEHNYKGSVLVDPFGVTLGDELIY